MKEPEKAEKVVNIDQEVEDTEAEEKEEAKAEVDIEVKVEVIEEEVKDPKVDQLIKIELKEEDTEKEMLKKVLFQKSQAIQVWLLLKEKKELTGEEKPPIIMVTQDKHSIHSIERVELAEEKKWPRPVMERVTGVMLEMKSPVSLKMLPLTSQQLNLLVMKALKERKVLQKRKLLMKKLKKNLQLKKLRKKKKPKE